MSSQRDIFLAGEGDQWFQRNKITQDTLQAKAAQDPVLKYLEKSSFTFYSVLEIGASNGWRLAVMQDRFPEARYTGIDPSTQAVENHFDNIQMYQATAERLPFEDGQYDLVVMGFCLYLCDRFDLFKIAAEVDRVLKDGAHIILYDFHSEIPYKNAYAHKDGVFSYKMDYSHLFSWNPCYESIEQIIMPHPGSDDMSPDNLVALNVLKKNAETVWGDNPYV
ncbi:MAG: class I SAM-dependent methyltransferase [Rhodospirillales bacterium]|nr:class I SAM-dependent methyltransferase [Rhodospirillales bacterium]